VKNPEKFDLIVVGGGPAGSVAAKTAAKGGLKTLLLEKDRDFGIPVRCAEGIGLKNLDKFIEPNPKFIDNKLEKVRFFAPDGNLVHLNLDEKGAILNRKVFDFELARLAAEAGAYVRNRCCATGLIRENGSVQLIFEHYNKEYKVTAPIIIGADGVESRVARWAGINSSITPIDIETCFQYTLHHPDVEEEYCDFYFGQLIAPKGYIWVFPKGGKLANVGIGVAASVNKDKSAKQRIEEFIEKKFPGASILSSVAGSVPSARVLKRLAADNVMIAGDAAHQSNPLTGGGIMSAMWGGMFAGETAVSALNRGDFSERGLSNYAKLYMKRVGDDYNYHYKLKRAVHKLTDKTLNKTASVINKLPFEERTLRRIFLTVLKNDPVLIAVVMKALLP